MPRFPKFGFRMAAIFVCLLPVGCANNQVDVPEKVAPAVTFEPPREAPTPPAYEPRPQNSLTFSKDIAPIVFQKCAGCHHPGEIGPFPLLSYADVKKRARQIVEVTQKRAMPPWSPVSGYCNFEQDRSLTTDEIGMLAQWVDEGVLIGDSADLPSVPEFSHGWKYGKPDLVVTMPEPFQIPAASTADVYRKFVIHVPIEETKYVRAFDFDPGNNGVVHHMRLRVDRTSLSQAQDRQDPTPGFDGTMFSGDTEPDGFFLVWTPGYEALKKRADVAWSLQKGTDLVLELHLHPTGKVETIQSSIALYFQPKPPQEHLQMVQLSCETIDISPGVKGEQYTDRFVLPIDTTILAVMPHAHYLATDFWSWAVLPDGKKVWLMRIADWDFNWQREYTYSQPVSLPKGTTLCMQVTYDNSADNLRNPHNPPRRVLIGRDTFNEMAQMFFQVLASNPNEGKLLLNDVHRKEFASNLQRERFLVDRGRGTTEVHFNLGCLYSMAGKFPDSLHHYEESIRLKSDNIFAINNLGSIYRKLGRPDDAEKQYTKALEIDPKDFRVRVNLGLIDLDRGRPLQATIHLEEALRINPQCAEAWLTLGLIAMRQEKLQLAQSHFERAIKANPNLESAYVNLRLVREQLARSR